MELYFVDQQDETNGLKPLDSLYMYISFVKLFAYIISILDFKKLETRSSCVVNQQDEKNWTKITLRYTVFFIITGCFLCNP